MANYTAAIAKGVDSTPQRGGSQVPPDFPPFFTANAYGKILRKSLDTLFSS